MKNLFPLITTYSLLLSIPVLAENNSDLFLPPVIVGGTERHAQTEVPLNYQADYVVDTDGTWERINFLDSLEDELRQQWDSSLDQFTISEIYVTGKSADGKGQVRLCSYTRNRNCYEISSVNLNNGKSAFRNPEKWLNLSLYSSSSKKKLAFPLDVEIKGKIKISQISVILKSIRPSRPPVIERPPHFLDGKSLLYNRGEVQIGEIKKLQKSPSGQSLTQLTMGNQNYLFVNYRWVEVKSYSNSAVISRIVANCLDHDGNRFVVTPRLGNGRQFRDHFLNLGDTFAFELDDECEYIETVMVEGYTPNTIGSRAEIEVNLR
jgi:hypothetical protein